MKAHLSLCLGLALLWGGSPVTDAASRQISAANEPQNRVLTAEQALEDLHILETAFSQIHPGYTRYTSESDMEAVWGMLRQRATQSTNVRLGDFYIDIQSALATIRCDHTKAEVPRAIKTQRQAMPAYFPFQWEIIEGRGYVHFATDESPVLAGDEIISIDGLTIREWVERLSPLVSIDGWNDHMRHHEIAYSNEFMGGLVEHISALDQQPSPYSELLIVRDNHQVRARVEKVGFEQWEQFLAQDTPFYRNFKDEIQLEFIGEDIARLSVNTFINYRQPVDPYVEFDRVFQALRDRGTGKLILDLRKNGGGSSEPAAALLSYFIERTDSISREVRVKTYDFGEFTPLLSTWDARALNPDPAWFTKTAEGDYRVDESLAVLTQPVTPSPLAFKGRVVALTSARNSSGSTSFLAKLQDLGRTTFIGEPTGGSAEGPTSGIIFFLTLPNSGIVARLPAQRDYNNVTAIPDGRGVIPDVLVPLQYEDVASGYDRTLAIAIQKLRE